MLQPYDILENAFTGDSKNITGCLGLKGGRDEQVKQREFLGYWNYLYDMVIVDTQKSGHMTLLKPTKIYSTEWTFF